jgi:outer membrane protein OmpA-like peptidoglycan-associated protein
MIGTRSIRAVAVAAACVAWVAASGCATKGYVQRQVADARGYTDTQFAQARARADEAWAKASLAERLGSGDYTEVSTQQVQFDFDDFRLKPEAQSTLDQLANELASHPHYGLEIRGYADARGTDRYNYRLGRERADEVYRYLVTRHTVPSNRVATISFGEESPVADNDSDEGRAQNRRVQVRLLEINVNQPTPVSMVP